MKVESGILNSDDVTSEVTQEEQYIHVGLEHTSTNRTEETVEIGFEDQTATLRALNEFHLIKPNEKQPTEEQDTSTLPRNDQVQIIKDASV